MLDLYQLSRLRLSLGLTYNQQTFFSQPNKKLSTLSGNLVLVIYTVRYIELQIF